MTNPDDKVQPELKAVHTNGYGEHAVWGFDGLTKREWFTAMAMQYVERIIITDVLGINASTRASKEDFARGCVLLADAVIAQLNEKK